MPAETPPVDGDLRELIRESFAPAMRIGLKDAELFDEPGAERVEEWITYITKWVTDAVSPVLERLRGELERRCSCDGDPIECSHEAARGQAEAELERLRRAMMGDSRERIEEIQAEMDALPKDERIRREAANAPLLRIQLAHFAGENQRLKDEMERTVQSAAAEVWEKAGFNALIHWKQRATQAEAAAAEWQAACEAHQTDGEALMAAIERVRAFHIRNAHTGDCEHCSERDYPDYAVPWPCPTIATLDAPSGARSPASGRTGVPRHTETTREAGEAQEAAE